MYKSPISSRIFDSLEEYQSHLVEIHYAITGDLGWKTVREGKRQFKQAYDDLHSQQNLIDIVSWISNNRDDLMFSPLLGRPHGKTSSSFTRMVPLSSKFVNHFDEPCVGYPYPEMNHHLDGSAWVIKAQFFMPSIQVPRFVALDLWRGMNSLGLYICDPTYEGRQDGDMRYDADIVILASEWREMAMMYKLQGKIRGPVKF